MTAPTDLRTRWIELAKALQEACPNGDSNGLSILQVKVLVNREGNPVNWTVPRITRVEPMRDPRALLDLLT